MSAPKKGKDLSALKARLAKKAAKADAPVPAPGEVIVPPAEPAAEPKLPAPGEAAADVPAPGQVAADIPAPGQVAADIPAPGQTAPVAPEPAPEAADNHGDPLGGGGFSPSFDPNDGLIEDVGGTVGNKSPIGLMALIAVASLGIGVVAGNLMSKKSYNEEVIATSSKKGPEIYAEISRVKDTRARIATKMDDLTAAVAQDGTAGAQQLDTLLGATFKDYPQINKLFGYELAAMPEAKIKKLFNLYAHSNGLAIDMGAWATFVKENAKILGEGRGGPKAFAVVPADNGVVLVGLSGLACGRGEDGSAVPCKDKTEQASAEFISIQRSLGGAPEVIPRAEAQILLPAGPIFKYAIAEKPETKTAVENARLIRRIKGRLEAMSEAEKAAFLAFEQFEEAAAALGGGGGGAPAPAPAAGGDAKPAPAAK